MISNSDHSIRQTALLQGSVHITCVVPVYNEAACLGDFLPALHQQLIQLSKHIEIILVDDGSSDDTVALATTLLTQMPLKIICFSRNFGKEMALTAGLKHATGDVCILIDADFQHPLTLLPEFLKQWASGYDMVYGVQQDRSHEKWLKRISSRLFYRLMTYLTKTALPPHAGDFRLLDRQVIDAINQFPERSRFMKGIYSWVGFKTMAVTFSAPQRFAGKSSWRFHKLTSLALTGIISFSDIPLRVWGWIGASIASFALIYGFCVVIATLWYGVDVPGYSTIVVGIMFLGGIQLLSIGILGEYMARIFSEVKQRPPYIIAKTYAIK